MLKTILTACAVSAALLASNVAFAQTAAPGEDKAPTAKPATKAEKDAAKKHRRSTSKEIAHGKGSLDSDNTVKSTDKAKATSEEKAAAKSKRKAEGASTAKTGSAGGEAATSGTK
jgi:hypothetical protein